MSEEKRFNPRKKLGTNSKKESEGAWQELGDGAAVKIRRRNNPTTQEFLRKKMRPHKRAIELEALPESVMDRIILDALVETLLADWRGIFDTDPTTKEEREIPFSREAARRLLSPKKDPTTGELIDEMKDFRDLLWSYANSAELFRLEAEEEDAKN